MEIIEKPRDTNLEMCLVSGQHFQWTKTDRGFVLWTGKKIWKIEEEGDRWLVQGSGLEDLAYFLSLDQDYGQIFEDLKREEALGPILESARGLRLLRQEAWDTILAFILSTNNNVARIQKSLLALGQLYGDPIGDFKNQTYYSLPSPEKLASIDPRDLRAKAGVGYRDKYLVKTAQMISDGLFRIGGIDGLGYDQALAQICRLSGVGKKAGDCILLFAYGYSQAFPVDTWMEKIMVDLYGPFKSREAISAFGQARFKDQAGLVQQVLFHYIRGLKKKGRGGP